jgi:serine/threonine protein kinase
LLKDKNDLSSIKICDFGLSAQFEENDQGKNFLETCGTRLFMAPELWNKKLYSKVIFIEMSNSSASRSLQLWYNTLSPPIRRQTPFMDREGNYQFLQI